MSGLWYGTDLRSESLPAAGDIVEFDLSAAKPESFGMPTNSSNQGVPAANGDKNGPAKRAGSNDSDADAAAKKRRGPSMSARGVANLTPEQLAKKRANDREAQRAIRERTKHQIEGLEQRIRELTEQQPYQELQVVLRQKEAAERENAEIRRRLAEVVGIIQPMLGNLVPGVAGGMAGPMMGVDMGGECLGCGSRSSSDVNLRYASISPSSVSVALWTTPGNWITFITYAQYPEFLLTSTTARTWTVACTTGPNAQRRSRPPTATSTSLESAKTRFDPRSGYGS